MRHLKLTSKKGTKIFLHVDELREAIPANDDVHTMCILKIKRKDGRDTVVYVQESMETIGKMLGEIEYRSKEAL